MDRNFYITPKLKEIKVKEEVNRGKREKKTKKKIAKIKLDRER